MSKGSAYPHRHQDTLAVATVFPPHGARALDAAWHPVARHIRQHHHRMHPVSVAA